MIITVLESPSYIDPTDLKFAIRFKEGDLEKEYNVELDNIVELPEAIKKCAEDFIKW